MKIILVVACAALAMAPAAHAAGSHRTKGYVKSNGTYVAPSGAKNPNRTRVDNYSTKGNVNPYSGKVGTKPAYTVPKYKAPK